MSPKIYTYIIRVFSFFHKSIIYYDYFFSLVNFFDLYHNLSTDLTKVHMNKLMKTSF